LVNYRKRTCFGWGLSWCCFLSCPVPGPVAGSAGSALLGLTLTDRKTVAVRDAPDVPRSYVSLGCSSCLRRCFFWAISTCPAVGSASNELRDLAHPFRVGLCTCSVCRASLASYHSIDHPCPWIIDSVHRPRHQCQERIEIRDCTILLCMDSSVTA